MQPNSTTFRTVTISSLNNYNVYSNVDYYYDDGTTQLLFTPAQLALRIILPNNYVQSQPVDTIIMFDQVLNTLIPTASLLFNVSSKELGCSLMRKGFATQITLSCSLTRPLTAVFQLSLFDSSLPNISLATASKPIDIYAAPSSPCSNQQCDLCSKTDTG